MLALTALLTGGMLSWFASENPDGPEWSIEKFSGTAELPEQEIGISAALKTLQGKTAFLPDYSFKQPEDAPEPAQAGQQETAWPAVEPGTQASGSLGSVIVLGAIFLIGFILKAVNKPRS